MPTHCDPCPENTKTSLCLRSPSLRPEDMPGRDSPSRNASRCSASCSRELPTRASLWSWWVLLAPAV